MRSNMNIVVGKHALIHKTAVIHPFVTIGDRVSIGEGAVVFNGAVIGRKPKGTPSMRNQPKSRHGLTHIGAGSVIGANAVIYDGVFIGDNVLIGDGVTIREDTYIGKGVIIGNNSTIQNDVIVSENSRVLDLSHVTARVIIGKNVFWSASVISLNDNSMDAGGKLQSPRVWDGAKIGGGAIIMPGVEVEDGAIVGAGSVVTHSVRSGDKVMGVPARTKKQREAVEAREAFELWWGNARKV